MREKGNGEEGNTWRGKFGIFAVGTMNASEPHAEATQLEAVIATVPEPTAWMLLAAGSLAVIVTSGLRRRRAG
jgi:hypothetical protein